MLQVPLMVNDEEIGLLRCVNIGGPKDGLCRYHCVYIERDTNITYQHTLMHWRPSGALALTAKVLQYLADTGMGRR